MTALRSLLFLVFFWAWSTVTAFVLLPFMLGPRRWMAFGLHVWGREVIAALEFICDLRVEVRGEPIPRGSAVIASKHQSSFDVFALLGLLPDACFVMKKELMIVPFFGWYAWKTGMIVVDREGGAAALKKLVRDTQDRLKEARQVVIFPEGTRGKPGVAGDYKPGIAALYRELGLPVTPLALNSGVHWPAKGVTRTPGVIAFDFLPAIPADLKRGEFMRLLQTSIETASTALIEERL